PLEEAHQIARLVVAGVRVELVEVDRRLGLVRLRLLAEVREPGRELRNGLGLAALELGKARGDARRDIVLVRALALARRGPLLRLRLVLVAFVGLVTFRIRRVGALELPLDAVIGPVAGSGLHAYADVAAGLEVLHGGAGTAPRDFLSSGAPAER